MTGLLRFLLPLGIIGLLAGCCANNVCDCQDERADAFFFKFATTGPGSFVPQTELDTVLLKRFALPLDSVGRPNIKNLSPKNRKITSFTSLADSLNTAGSYDLVTIVRSTTSQRGLDTLFISNNLPFSQSGSRKLNTYLYRIEVRRAPGQILKINPRRFELDSITLKGEFDGTGCCTCYRNTSKTATLSKLPPQGSGSQRVLATEPAPNKPVYTTITK